MEQSRQYTEKVVLFLTQLDYLGKVVGWDVSLSELVCPQEMAPSPSTAPPLVRGKCFLI